MNLTSYLRGDHGGEETHTLSLAEMPTHEHVRVTVGNDNAGGDYPILRPGSPASHGLGGGESHNNMPPYVALDFCRFVGE